MEFLPKSETLQMNDRGDVPIRQCLFWRRWLIFSDIEFIPQPVSIVLTGPSRMCCGAAFQAIFWANSLIWKALHCGIAAAEVSSFRNGSRTPAGRMRQERGCSL
jgi:hypothetical protein